MSDKCPFICDFKTSEGYCKVTACVNPKHNGSGTYTLKEWYGETGYKKKYERRDFQAGID